jgi:hypothetical protein
VFTVYLLRKSKAYIEFREMWSCPWKRRERWSFRNLKAEAAIVRLHALKYAIN